MIFTLQNYTNSQIYAKKFSNLYEKILKSMRKNSQISFLICFFSIIAT